MTDQSPVTVPFSKLFVDETNARSSNRKVGIAELAANIKLKGLIEALVVRPAGDGRYSITNGSRRYGALSLLVKEKHFPRSYPVPVHVRDETEAEAIDTSLAANIFALPMHAVDQFETFTRLIEQGQTAADVAARYSMPERKVRQALALGKLAPEIREAWRKGKLESAIAQAFTIHPDPAVQAAAYERLRKQGKHALSDHGVRRELSQERTPKSNVSEHILQAYIAAGGKLVEDLFGDNDYLEDGALLRRVTAEWEAQKTAEIRALLSGQGWAWVATAGELPRNAQWVWSKIEADLTDEEEERIASARQQAYTAKGDVERRKAFASVDALSEELISSKFTREMRARSGVIIEIDDDGDIELTYGVIRPSADGTRDLEDAIDEARNDDDLEHDPDDEDLPPVSAMVEDDEDDDADDEAAESDGPKLSQALSQTLTEALTIAAASALSKGPDVAMRLITAALICEWAAPANVSNNGHHLVRNTGDRPNFSTAFRRLLGADQGTAEQCFAEAVASTLDLTFNAWRYKGRESGIADLIAALPAAEFHAAALEAFNAVDFFKRAPKAVALEAIGEIREAGVAWDLAPEDVLAEMKKPELASVAAQKAADTGWLPSDLRGPAYALKLGAECPL